MRFFSKEIKNFLTGIASNENVSIVPKSDSAATAGDIVFFRYSLGSGQGSRSYRIFLLTEPITKQAKTGNLLLTGFRLKNLGDFGSDSFTAKNVISLYNNNKGVDTLFNKLNRDKLSNRLLKNIETTKKKSELKLPIKLKKVKSVFLDNKIGSEYRTYIMTKIFGPIRKITLNKEVS